MKVLVVSLLLYIVVYWNPSISYDNTGSNIEYDVFSSINTIDWMFEQRTTKTNVFITNSYPAQYYRVGAHYKL